MRPSARTSKTLLCATLSILVTTAALPQARAAGTGSEVFGGVTGTVHNFGLACGNPANTPCELTATAQGVAVAHQSPGGASAPYDGVITGWSLSHGRLEGSGGQTAVAAYLTTDLRVIHGSGKTGIGAGTGPTEDLPQAAGIYSFPARLPVHAGDIIGYDLRFSPGDLILWSAVVGDPGDVVGYSSVWPDGGSPGFYSASTDPCCSTNAYLAMNATIEPDADADGYGDATQDLCPTNAATHGECPVVDTKPPQTKITKKPAKSSTKRMAKFRFKSTEAHSTFECSLRGPGLPKNVKKFRRCTTPRKYKALKPGKYVFKVRAIDRAKNVDPTPAKATFRVKPAR